MLMKLKSQVSFLIDQGRPDFFVQGPYLKIIFHFFKFSLFLMHIEEKYVQFLSKLV